MTQPWIPIYLNHDRMRPPIGQFRQVEGEPRIEVQFEIPLTKEQVFEIFGGAGITTKQGDALIDALHIYEFSLCAQPATPQRPVK